MSKPEKKRYCVRYKKSDYAEVYVDAKSADEAMRLADKAVKSPSIKARVGIHIRGGTFRMFDLKEMS